jgi:hypothetical protein
MEFGWCFLVGTCGCGYLWGSMMRFFPFHFPRLSLDAFSLLELLFFEALEACLGECWEEWLEARPPTAE